MPLTRFALTLGVVLTTFALDGPLVAAPRRVGSTPPDHVGADNEGARPDRGTRPSRDPEPSTGSQEGGQDSRSRPVPPDVNVAPREAPPPDHQRPAAVDEDDDVDLEELQRRVDVLAEEVERLRSGEVQEVELTDDDRRALGLAPSAAATYARGRGVSIAGYGEMLYEHFGSENEAGRPTGKGAQLDFLRAIIYAGYRFNDKFLFNSEIEVEHANEVFVEFAYVDYLVRENFGIRGGLLLHPMGLVNEFHEPTVFLGAERPVTEQHIIPSTWRENGGGLHGSVDRVAFRAYVLNGLDATGFSSRGIRGGRQKGSKTRASHMAFTGRVDVTPTPGVFLGASLYTGGSGQGQIEVDGRNVDVRTTIVDLHGQAQMRGLDLRGLYARADIDEAAELNQALGLTGGQGVAELMQGGYVQVGYDVLSQVSAGGVALTPYVRHERVDTQARMPAGFERSLSTDNTFTTVGLEVKPIPNVVVKVDHAWVSNDAGTGVNQFNVNLGYAF